MGVVQIKDRVQKWRDKQKQAGGKSVSLVLNADAAIKLDELKQLSNLSTIADVINQSISTYKALIDRESQGYELWAIPKKTSEEVVAERICLIDQKCGQGVQDEKSA